MPPTAVIAGVGPGLGESIARKFAAEGCEVGLLARSAEYLEELAADLGESAGHAIAVPTGFTWPTSSSTVRYSPPGAREHPDERPEESFLDPDEIARNYWHLVEQGRSAWTLELDLRPHVEEF